MRCSWYYFITKYGFWEIPVILQVFSPSGLSQHNSRRIILHRGLGHFPYSRTREKSPEFDLGIFLVENSIRRIWINTVKVWWMKENSVFEWIRQHNNIKFSREKRLFWFSIHNVVFFVTWKSQKVTLYYYNTLLYTG